MIPNDARHTLARTAGFVAVTFAAVSLAACGNGNEPDGRQGAATPAATTQGSPTPAAVPARPTAVDQPSGTDALLIGISVVNESVVWLSGTNGTWLRTTDGGAQWTVGQVPGAEELQFRDVHARGPDTAWLLSIGNGPDSRIYRTVDGGVTWDLQFLNDDPRGFYDCLDFWDGERGIVIGDEIDGAVSMLETRDAGATWSMVPSERLPAAQAGEGSFAASGTCLVAGPEGRAWVVASNPEYGRLLRTTDFGATWTVDTLPLTVRSGVGPQSVAFRDGLHGMVLQGGADSEPTDTGAAFSDDGGVSWTPRARAPLAVGVWGSAWVPGATAPTLVAVSPSGAVYTRDDGRTWSTIDANDYWTVGFASSNAGWAVGRNGRITKLSGF